jgi:hypothetical protein
MVLRKANVKLPYRYHPESKPGTHAQHDKKEALAHLIE